jgi:hypothetical protein
MAMMETRSSGEANLDTEEVVALHVTLSLLERTLLVKAIFRKTA